jgi:DNA polymerase-3 subunit gamma/tau
VCKDPQTVKLLEVGEKTKEKYLAQSQQVSPEVLFRYLEIANKCDVDFKMAQNQRLHTELALLKMCHVTVATFNKQTESPVQSTDRSEVKTNIAHKPEIKSASIPDQQKQIQGQDVGEKKSGTDKNEKPGIPQGNSFEKKTSSPGTISINRKLNQSKTEIESQKEKASDELPVNNKSFSEQDLIAAIKSYADQVLAGGKKQLAVTLKKHNPVLLNNAVIEIPVDNPIQAEDVNSSKSDIQSYLRQRFENTLIEVKARLVEDGEGEETAYTPGEKFKKMAEKNPDLNQFKQQFGLELDF